MCVEGEERQRDADDSTGERSQEETQRAAVEKFNQCI